MRIYIASGFSVMNKAGKEKQLCNKFGTINRLLSYFFFTPAGSCTYINQIWKVAAKHDNNK